MRSPCDRTHENGAVGSGEHQETWFISLAATDHQFCKNTAAASLRYNSLTLVNKKFPILDTDGSSQKTEEE